MKIALIGGTGRLGRGLAVRLSVANEPMIGSRDSEKASRLAEELETGSGKKVIGGTNESVAGMCDIAVLTIPDARDMGFLRQLRSPLTGKLVISPIVPMNPDGVLMTYSGGEKSAAEEVASLLGESRVVAALHNVPARALENPLYRLDCDVLVASDSPEDFKETANLIQSIEGLRPLHVGPLRMSRAVERITPLLLNAAKLNGLKRLSIKFVS